jgi:signal transduction histidine kinase
VIDNGIGIKSEHLPNIFKRFYRADKARTAGNEVHAGLGLSMVQILTKNYGGKIEVESDYGEGTTFTLYFPLYEQANIR